MPTVSMPLRALAVLAALTAIVANGTHLNIAALVLAAIYTVYWFALPRPWSLVLALLTLPAAFAATAIPHQALLDDALFLWACPALALGFTFPSARGLAIQLTVLALAMAGSLVLADAASTFREASLAALPILLASLTAATARRLLAANEELAGARQQLAVVAVQEERARFARDLHDLLGHSLTVLVAKLRLARRLPPGEAAAELQEAEHLALGALDEVRQAVEGYRALTLGSQIAGARTALDAARVALDVSGSPGPIPNEAEHVLALAVREAVTNVLRHSAAGHCWVSLGRDDGTAWVEVRDDGRGAEGTPGPGGLNGIRDRAAALGGSAVWGPAPGGGFRARVTVPAQR